MQTYARASVALLLMLLASPAVSGQSTNREKDVTATITGRVTSDGKAQPGVVVSLFMAEDMNYDRRSLANIITDADGIYRFTGVAAGRYSVSAYSPLFVNSETDHNGRSGRLVAVDAGEAVEDINFSLARGGVITGRVTDAEGRPAIALAVALLKVVDGRFTQIFRTPDLQMMTTDDRGIYRIYGVLPGKYLVKVGASPTMNRALTGGGRYTSYLQTFHPDTTEQSKATVVEVTPGGEAAGIDIKVGHIKKTYVATGRMIDAETGRPLPNIYYGVRLGEGGRQPMPGGYRTNEKGEFRIELAVPSRVTIYPASNAESNTMGQPFSFDLTTERVTGLEIKLGRAQTLSGIVVAEGANSAGAAKLSSLSITVQCVSPDRSSQNSLYAKVREDGSFAVGGIIAGRVSIYLNGPDKSMPKPWLVRVERNGADQGKDFEIAEGENISDLRLVVAYGSGIVRGQVKLEGRSLEETNLFTDLSIFVGFRHTSTARVFAGAQLDARGRFVAEGLLDGEYEIMLRPQREPSDDQAGRDLVSRILEVKQRITVTNGAESMMTILLDLSEKK